MFDRDFPKSCFRIFLLKSFVYFFELEEHVLTIQSLQAQLEKTAREKVTFFIFRKANVTDYFMD